MMPTDDEKRRVAEMLRKSDGPSLMVLMSALGVGGDRVLDRLADLIEPNRGSGGRTILCAYCESMSWCGCEPGDEQGGCDFEPSVTEGEPPYNLYSLYEAVFRRHPTDEYAIDDDEVEELVDALLDICNAPDHDIIQRPQPSCGRDALLKLADEMGRVRSRCDFCIKKGDCDWADETVCLESRIDDFAIRIREACGEVEPCDERS